jgi:preprotein translocase subunit SecD
MASKWGVVAGLVLLGSFVGDLSYADPPRRRTSAPTTTAQQQPFNGIYPVITEGAGRVFLDPQPPHLPVMIDIIPIVASRDFATVTPTISQIGMPEISITLKATGTKAFARYTREHIGGRAAIIIDNKLLSVPVITGQINGGGLVIGGNFTAEEAQNLARSISGQPANPRRR